ncbi:ABC transporter substrate-binding protein [Actinomadura sp. NBRC 104425]|uniref:glutamate ABC transporter substrate-binding protein n=1 Tax=Actinomadura sp. NBRC 104425 TaxID=3032204 RepID=UPI0024A582F6|nr:glutamate ABC transporter substrate-binding protein [Actinomadura sp. NBRC 104425]GLZ14043.1 ABC transporter substrate-binding protein [Actinomadura sp. NBRC 104425]
MHNRRLPRRGIALAAAAAAVAAPAGCALEPEADTIVGARSLTIGVKADQPHLGLRRSDGRYEGFDVDVAVYLAGRLGVPPERIRFRTTPSSVRERALQDGTVDMIVASYSITAPRKTKVTFAGPYYVPHQDTLVRADDTSIRSVRDLEGKRLCQVTGSNSWRRVTEEREIKATLVRVDTYSECMDLLDQRRVDAVSTDDLILAGFAAGRSGRILNAPFTDEKYGIGLHKGDLAGCEALNRAITRMYQDGTAARLLDKWFGKSGLKLTTSIPQFEGCS